MIHDSAEPFKQISMKQMPKLCFDGPVDYFLMLKKNQEVSDRLCKTVWWFISEDCRWKL